MKTMKWLLQREFWENKGSMFWAPVVAGTLIVLMVAGSMAWGLAHSEGFHIHAGERHTSMGAMVNAMPVDEKAKIVDVISHAYLATAAPLYVMMSVIAFFYCLGALYDERRDRSILFWKSLPVSDAQTVISKVLTAILVAPVITIAVATFTSVLLLLLGGLMLAVNGVNLFGAVLSSSAVYLAPLEMIGLLPVYMLWALPTVGWLLLVSSWAKSKVFLWAVGVPLLLMAIIKWADFMFSMNLDLQWFSQNVLARGLGGLVPDVWLPAEHVAKEALLNPDVEVVSLGKVLVESWKTMVSPQALVGAVAGIGMIFGAIRMRRWKDEG